MRVVKYLDLQVGRACGIYLKGEKREGSVMSRSAQSSVNSSVSSTSNSTKQSTKVSTKRVTSKASHGGSAGGKSLASQSNSAAKGSKKVSQKIVSRTQPVGTNDKARKVKPRTSGGGLTSKQFQELSAQLKSLRSELQAALLGKADAFNMGAQAESLIKGDDAEVAEKQRMNNAALQELDFLKTRLGLVQRAMAKMEAGVYGMCEETEEPIGFERLTVVPWARFAVHVQEVRERKLREYRGSRLRSE